MIAPEKNDGGLDQNCFFKQNTHTIQIPSSGIGSFVALADIVVRDLMLFKNQPAAKNLN